MVIKAVIVDEVAGGTKRILIDSTTIVNDDTIFRHHTDKDGLVIEGDATRGAMYSVYHFLEQKLNWRFFASDTEVCYDANRVDLANLDYEFKHQYAIRELFFYDYKNPEIAVKRYLNGTSHPLDNYDGAISYTPLGIHNFGWLTNTGGGSDPNPCLNNNMIRKLMLRKLKNFMAEIPDC